jgi:hypothetical protein
MATLPGRLNPYKLGSKLLRDIEEPWDKGCIDTFLTPEQDDFILRHSSTGIRHKLLFLV